LIKAFVCCTHAIVHIFNYAKMMPDSIMLRSTQFKVEVKAKVKGESYSL
jgi:hypothetical protein